MFSVGKCLTIQRYFCPLSCARLGGIYGFLDLYVRGSFTRRVLCGAEKKKHTHTKFPTSFSDQCSISVLQVSNHCLASFQPVSRQFPTSFSDQCSISVQQVSNHCLASFQPVSHQFPTRVLPVSYQYPPTFPPVSDQCPTCVLYQLPTSAMPVSTYCPTRLQPLFYQFPTSVLPVLQPVSYQFSPPSCCYQH